MGRAAFGFGYTFPTPEIYYNGCNNEANQPIQWAMISQAGAYYYNEQIYFQGLLDQGSCLNSSQAWNAFWTALNNQPPTAPGSAFGFSLHI